MKAPKQVPPREISNATIARSAKKPTGIRTPRRILVFCDVFSFSMAGVFSFSMAGVFSFSMADVEPNFGASDAVVVHRLLLRGGVWDPHCV